MPAEQLNEQEIQFKKRARRRLVGAIALVLLMVTVLPMLLDDRSARTPQQEIAITIPSQQDTDFNSKVAPAAPESEATETADNNTDTAAPESAELAASSPEPVAEKPVSEKPVVEKQPESEPAADSEAYAVQIGVYSTMASVKDLQRKLLAQGFKTYTEKLATDQGDKIRLRAGPFASRADAEKALAKIKSAGMAGMVVTK
jgi:DedD protein